MTSYGRVSVRKGLTWRFPSAGARTSMGLRLGPAPRRLHPAHLSRPSHTEPSGQRAQRMPGRAGQGDGGASEREGQRPSSLVAREILTTTAEPLAPTPLACSAPHHRALALLREGAERIRPPYSPTALAPSAASSILHSLAPPAGSIPGPETALAQLQWRKTSKAKATPQDRLASAKSIENQEPGRKRPEATLGKRTGDWAPLHAWVDLLARSSDRRGITAENANFGGDSVTEGGSDHRRSTTGSSRASVEEGRGT